MLNKQALINRVKECAEGKPEFAKTEDPHYLKFVAAVNAITTKYHTDPVRPWKLFALWWISGRFQGHWTTPKRETMSRMIWVMLHYELTEREMGFVVLAWMRSHGRRPNQREVIEIETTMIRVATDARSSVKRLRDKRNAKRRKMNNPAGRTIGRPPKTDGVRVKILEELNNHPATPAYLANVIGAKNTAVRSTLFRMVKAGEVKRHCGLYAACVPQELGYDASPTQPMLVSLATPPTLSIAQQASIVKTQPEPEKQVTDPEVKAEVQRQMKLTTAEWIAENAKKWKPAPTLNYNP